MSVRSPRTDAGKHLYPELLPTSLPCLKSPCLACMFLPFPKILRSYFIWMLPKPGLYAMGLLASTKSRDGPVCCGCGVPRTLALWQWSVSGTVAIVQVRNSEEKKSPYQPFYKVIHLLLMTSAVEKFPHTWLCSPEDFSSRLQ